MRPRKAFLVALQITLLAGVLWVAWDRLSGDWAEIAPAWERMHVRPWLLLASGTMVFASYALLIETWRRVVSAWGSRISFWTATRIWVISNLGKYLPGKVWQLAAMGTMSQQAGVAPAVAVGSSLYINVINVLAGFALCLFCAPGVLPISKWVAIALGASAAVFVLIPRAIPALVAWAARRFKRELTLTPLGYGTIITTFVSCMVAWFMQGAAFTLLAHATMDNLSGALPRYVALYTSSYLTGYLSVFAAGGLVVRETAMVLYANVYGLMTGPQVLILALVSRLWLTILELVPGLILLAISPKRPTAATNESRPV